MSQASPCPRCSQFNAVNARFCSQCGASIATAPAAGGPSGFSPRPQARARRGSVKRALLIVAATSLPLMLSFGAFADGCGIGSVQGQLVSTGEPYGDYTLQPSNCFSGEHESFFGVWVTPELQEVEDGQGWKGGLKVLKNHTGQWEVFVESPIECESLECKIRPLDPEQCKVFDVEVHNTNTTFNDIRVREGHAKLACSFPEGGSLKAELNFGGCS